MIYKSDIAGRIRMMWRFGITEVCIMLRRRIMRGWEGGWVIGSLVLGKGHFWMWRVSQGWRRCASCPKRAMRRTDSRSLDQRMRLSWRFGIALIYPLALVPSPLLQLDSSFPYNTAFFLLFLPLIRDHYRNGENASCRAVFKKKVWGVEGQDGLGEWT